MRKLLLRADNTVFPRPNFRVWFANQAALDSFIEDEELRETHGELHEAPRLRVIWEFWKAGFERSFHDSPRVVDLGYIDDQDRRARILARELDRGETFEVRLKNALALLRCPSCRGSVVVGRLHHRGRFPEGSGDMKRPIPEELYLAPKLSSPLSLSRFAR